MLDSTGRHWEEKIPCFLCDKNPIKFKVYQPECGHNGEELENYPHCVEAGSISSLAGAIFFEIGPGEDHKQPLVFSEKIAGDIFRPSNKGYHHNGYLLPDFGELVRQVAYVCANCGPRTAYSSETEKMRLQVELAAASLRKFHARYFRALGELVSSGVILVRRTGLRRRMRRRLDTNERHNLTKDLGAMLSTLKAIPQSNGTKKAVRTLDQLVKAL